MKNGKPLALFSQALKGITHLMSTYEKTLYALVYAQIEALLAKVEVYSQNWSTKHKIPTGQKVGTPIQQRWITKLFSYDFIVEYKEGILIEW